METQDDRDEHVSQVRDGLFMAASRTYGEQYVEPIIRERFGLLAPGSDDHDAVDEDGYRYEIKACKVLRPTGNIGTGKSLLDRVLSENELPVPDRAVPFAEYEFAEYLANVQNVKRDHFEFLVYALLFADCVKVFKAPSDDIATGKFKSWSDKHGRYDELGKSGQFPITRNTIQWHLDRYLWATLTYEEVVEIVERISDNQ